MQLRYCNLQLSILALLLCLPLQLSTGQESSEKGPLSSEKRQSDESELEALILRRIEEHKQDAEARAACKRLAAELLKIYDVNKNRRIDQTEFRRIWRSPDEADMNGDGDIGELELNKWLLQRLLPPNSLKQKPDRSGLGGDAYKRYAEGLIKSYDKNKDGLLSKEELKNMRSPPKDADKNLDGYVDKHELIDSVMNRSGKK
jgi:Ca2+-binding EF-hand superfamily protein